MPKTPSAQGTRTFALALLLLVPLSCTDEAGKTGKSVKTGKNEQTFRFDAGQPGKTAAGFTNHSGDWKVLADPTAPSKGNVLAQRAQDAAAPYNVTLIPATHYRDVDLSVKMKAVAGEEDRGGGPVWRARDGANYYVCRFNPLEDNFRVYKVVKGEREQLKSAAFHAAAGWHTLRVTMRGGRITCFFDGKAYLKVSDSTFAGAGQVGLWTKADARTHFDDLAVKAIP